MRWAILGASTTGLRPPDTVTVFRGNDRRDHGVECADVQLHDHRDDTDGSVVWTARDAWERACEIRSIADRHYKTDCLTVVPWTIGIIQERLCSSGKLKNRVLRIGGWRNSEAVTTYSPSGCWPGWRHCIHLARLR
jgi:hypothetical protein